MDQEQLLEQWWEKLESRTEVSEILRDGVKKGHMLIKWNMKKQDFTFELTHEGCVAAGFHD